MEITLTGARRLNFALPGPALRTSHTSSAHTGTVAWVHMRWFSLSHSGRGSTGQTPFVRMAF